jgi:hypothetical protein
VIDVLPEDQIPNNTLFLRTIDIEDAGASMYKDLNIYQALPSVASY